MTTVYVAKYDVMTENLYGIQRKTRDVGIYCTAGRAAHAVERALKEVVRDICHSPLDMSKLEVWTDGNNYEYSCHREYLDGCDSIFATISEEPVL